MIGEAKQKGQARDPLQRMPRDPIIKTISDLLSDTVPDMDRASLGPDTRFSDLTIKSIEMVTLIFEIEDHFDIAIVEANLDHFETIGEARDIIERLIDAREGERA